MSPRVKDHSADLSQGVVRKWMRVCLCCSYWPGPQGTPLMPPLRLCIGLLVSSLSNINQVCRHSTVLYTVGWLMWNPLPIRMTLTQSLLCKSCPQMWDYTFNFLDFFEILLALALWQQCWHDWALVRGTDLPGIWGKLGCCFFSFRFSTHIYRSRKENEPLLVPHGEIAG